MVRGDALRILEQHSDFQSGQLTRIRRQRKAEYRKAVELAAQKRTLEAFTQLERIGAITESSTDNLHDKAARSYLKALEQNRSALLVAPTWAEIEAVTAVSYTHLLRRFVWSVAEYLEAGRPVKAPTLTPPDFPDGGCRGF